MNYPEYERSQELAAQGDHALSCLRAIFDDVQPAHDTLTSLQRRVYKDTDAGISVSFELDDGTRIWSGNPSADDPSLVGRVRRIGFSSIVEGSDHVVDLTWLDLLDDKIENPVVAVAEFNRLAEETNDAACAIWELEHGDDDGTDDRPPDLWQLDP
jgi:hypothetical protein